MDPFALSALGAAGSAFVAACAYWAKTNHERRRVTRTVLYYLLELHHVLNRSSIALKSIENILLTEVRKALEARGQPFSEEDYKAAMKLALPHLARFALTELEASVAESADSFSKALSDLARENPILAFRLRGRDKLVLLGSKLQEFTKLSTTSEKTLEEELSLLKQLLLSLSEEDLRNSIRSTAWGCDIITHLKVLVLLRRAQRKEPPEQLVEIVGRIVEDVFVKR